jgi:hypothetical protein
MTKDIFLYSWLVLWMIIPCRVYVRNLSAYRSCSTSVDLDLIRLLASLTWSAVK